MPLLMYVGGFVLLRNFPFVGEVRLTVLTRFRERAIRSYRTIDRVGPSKRDSIRSYSAELYRESPLCR